MHSNHHKGELSYKVHLLFLASQYLHQGIFSVPDVYCLMIS
jgi:hypothetical protein